MAIMMRAEDSPSCRRSGIGEVKLLHNQMDELFAVLNRKLFSKTKILESSDNVISVCIGF